jgi:hypothetical protein
MITYESCPACLDAGRFRDDCAMCEGEGWVEEIISVDALAELDEPESAPAGDDDGPGEVIDLGELEDLDLGDFDDEEYPS